MLFFSVVKQNVGKEREKERKREREKQRNRETEKQRNRETEKERKSIFTKLFTVFF